MCVGGVDNTDYVFAITESITSTVTNGVATFGTTTNPIEVKEGNFLTRQFVNNASIDQRFTLDNSSIDTSSIVVYVKGPADTGLGKQYKMIDNIINVTSSSETYLIQEIQDERYEILFGDGIFGKS